jgi:hypothetical protein
MFRVLAILAAVLAPTLTAAPASAAPIERGPSALFVPVPYPNMGGTVAKGTNDGGPDYMVVELNNTLVMS